MRDKKLATNSQTSMSCFQFWLRWGELREMPAKWHKSDILKQTYRTWIYDFFWFSESILRYSVSQNSLVPQVKTGHVSKDQDFRLRAPLV